MKIVKAAPWASRDPLSHAVILKGNDNAIHGLISELLFLTRLNGFAFFSSSYFSLLQFVN